MNKLYDFFLKEPLKKHDLLCFHSLVLVLVFLSLASFSNLRAQCILDITTSVGECRFNEQTKQSEVLVAVSADWSNEPAGALIQVTFKGITKTIDPATAGCPGYVQFIVPLTMPIATPEIVTAQFASGTCSMATKNVTLPAACPTPLCDLNDLNAMGGYIFNDFDADGVRDPSEYGIKGVRVQLFDCDNNEVCSTVSGENGHWACFNLTRGVLFRVEFSNFPEGYYPGGSGRNASRTEVQFAYSSNCDIDFGLLRPDLFVEDNPWIVTPCYVNGLPEPGSESGNADVLVALEHNVPDNSGDVNHYLAIGSEIGSVWGVAFDKKTNRLFSASMLKRHVGWGPGGLGGIYATDLSTLPGLPSTGSTSLFINLDDLGINTGDESSIPRDLGPTLLSPSYDEAAFDLIGKMGLGDLEISDDGSTLYAVNLFLRTLVIIDIANKTATQINIPNNSCSNSADWRPWALKYHKGKLYVGGICSGQSTYGNPLTPKGDRKQLSATIYEFNPLLLSFTETFSFPLDYTKGSSTAFLGVNNPQTSKQWNVWTNNFADLIANVDIIPELGYPQPILGDIEFDVYGNMMLGFIDRAGHQVGWNNFGTSSATFGTTLYKGNSGGDLLRVYNNNGTWLLEHNAQAGYDKTEGENTGEGPCGGEFYFDDKYIDPGETALGGIAVHPSNNQMIAAIIDPFSIYSAGVGWFNNSTGALNKRARIYQGSTGSDGTFGKSAGLGDVELISREATVEVGNYVWEDRNFNGIQDPCELPLAAVNIALYRENGTLVASTTSSSTGFYKFANLEPNTAYILAFGANGQSQNGILTLNGKKYRATTLNVSNNSKDHIDSDITLAGSSVPAALQGLQVVTFTTGERGANNYSFDAGLVLNNFICPTITKLTVPTNLCANTPFSLEASELKNMAAAANLVQNFGIQFVYFNSPTTNPYAGGTALGSVGFGNLGSGGTTAILNNVNLPVGTYHIYAILSPTPTDPNCRPAANGVLTIVENPTSLLTFDDNSIAKTICVGGTASLSYSATLPAGFGCSWTLKDNNGTAIATGTSSVANTTIAIPNVSSLSAGSYTYTLSANCTSGGCSVADKTINLTVLSDPTSTLSFNGGGTAQTICVGGTASIDYSVTLPDGGGCSWTLTGQNVNLSGSSSAAATTIAIPNANQLAPGTYNYTIAVNCSTGGCNLESKQITLTVLPDPISTLSFNGSGSAQTICVGGTASIDYSVTLPNGGGCGWTLTGQNVNLSGSSSVAATTISIPNANQLQPGTYNYTIAVNCSTGGCNLENKQITLTVLPDPTSTLSFNGGGSAQTICVGGTASIDYSVTLPDGGGCGWTLTGQNINLSGSSSVTTTTIVIPDANKLVPGTYNYTIAVNCSTGGCNLESKQITLTVLPDPTSTLSFNGGGSAQTICVGGTASIDYSVTLPDGGCCSWTLTGQNVNLSGSSSVARTTIAIPNANQLAPGTYNYTIAVNCSTGGCNLENKQITLTVLPDPTSTLSFNGGGSAQTICVGGSASIDYSVTLPNGGGCGWTLTGQNVNLNGSSSVATTTIAIPNANQLEPGTYNYTLSVNCTTGDCNLESKQITLTVLANPASTLRFEGGDSTKTICAGGSANISYSTDLPEGCSWTLTGQNVNLNGSSSVATTTIAISNANQLEPGTYNYTLSVNCTTGDCNLESKQIILTVLANPASTLSFEGGDSTKTICAGGSANISYSTDLPEGCSWTLTGQNVNLNGSSSVTATTIAIPNAGDLLPGTYNYTLSVNCTTGDCNLESKQITLTVLANPASTLSFEGGDSTKTICAGGSASISYSTDLPEGCTWTLTGQNVNLNGSSSAAATTIAIPNADDLLPGTYNYTLSVNCTTGDCNLESKQIILTVLANPASTLHFEGGDSTKTICAGGSANISYSTDLPEGCTWTLTGQNVNLNGSSSVAATTIAIPNANQLEPGTYNYIIAVNCSTGGCNLESKQITLTVLANPASTLRFEGGDSSKTICAGGSASIDYSVSLPSGCTWTLTGQNVNLNGSSSVAATTIAIPNANQLEPGIYNYTLSVNCTTGDCNLESKQITLTVLGNPASTLSFEGGNSTKTICAGGSASISYSVSLPSGCNWALTGQNVNISGTSSVNATTIAIPNADQLTPGNYIYMLFVDCGSGECTVESKQITLTVLENPSSTLIFNGGGTTKTICAGGSASIDYSVTLPTNCTWTLTGQNVNLSGTSSVATTTIAIPNADLLAPGVYKYTLTANCPSSDCNTESKEITLTVLAYPASSLSFSDNTLTKTICAGSAASIQYSITLPNGSNCSWKLTGQNVNLSGSSSVATTTLAIPNVTQLSAGTYKYTLTINCPTSDCNIESKEISLTILPNPSATLAFNGGGTTKTICTGETAAIDYSVNLLGSTDCNWTLTGQNVNLSGSSSVSIKTINIPNAEQLAPGTYDYILTASCASGDCGTVNKKITLTVLPDPTTSLSFIGGGTSKTVCAGNVVGIAYSVSLPSGSTCTWTLQGQNLSLSGRNSVSSGAINIPSSDQLVPGTYIYTLSVKCTSGGCSVPDKQITLTVLPAPSLSLNQNGNCSNGSQCATTNATINYKVSLPTGYGCTWTLTGKNVNLSGTSSVDISNYRIPNLDQVTPGLYTYTLAVKCTSGNCNVESKTISIHVGNNAVHNYVIGFPADKKGSCGAVLDTCIYIQENGCDLLAIAVKDLKYKASGDECYKIERTFKVINWCEYDGISDPYVISRDVDGDGVPGDEDIWVIRRPTRTYLDRSGIASNNWVQDLCGNNVELPDEKDGTPAQNTEGRSTPLTDQFPDAPWNQLNPRGAWDWADIKPFSQGGTNDDNNATDDKLYAPGQRALSTGRNSSNFTTGYWEYTQWIKVYDEVDPIVTAQEQLFCSYSTDLAKGCPASAEVEFTVDEPCTPDDLTIKVFLDAFSNGTIDASSLLPANTLKANFGASITGTYPYFVISGGKYPLGEHVFEVHVLDGCGNSTVAKIPFSVIDCKAPSPICVNGIAVDLMPVIPFADVDGDGDLEKGAMTVWASDFANVDKISDCSEPIQLAIYRSDDPALANPNFVPNTAHTSIIVTCDDLSNTNPNATGSPVLVRVYAIETPKSAKDNINNFDYCETYVLVQDTPADGLVINCSPASPGLIAGTIATEKAKLVKDVTVQMSGQRSASIRTTNEGHYNFSNLQLGYDYTITPTLDANPHNGVSTFDLVLMNKHILGEQLLDSPYKMIAADVNRSKSITTLDLIQLRKLILGVNPHFTNNTSWRFVAKTYTFPNPNNPWLEDFPEIINFNNLSGTYSNVDFVAIKIGDVTANAVANSSEETEIRDFKGTFSINVENTALKTDNVYTVDFRAADLNGIQGYQGTLALDISTIEVIDLVPGIAKADHFGWNYLDQGLITFSWNGAAPAQDAVLFSLVLRAKAEGTLANSLTISSRYTTAEAYDINNNLLNIALQYSNGLVTGTGFALEQNMPNPFSSKTMIRFHLPQVAEAILTISDITGKVVKQVQGTYAKGYNTVELSSSELPAGVLTYTLQSGAFHATKKMIVIK